MPNTIIDYSKEIIKFLDNVNYGTSKPQFNHLATIIEGSINIEVKVSISKIAENIAKAKDKSCVCRFLSDSTWDNYVIKQ